MASISCRHVKKVYPGNVVAVPDFSLEIADKEFIVFVGPSGCGKSTTLRMIAGLEEISGGEMYIGDRLINDVPPKDRDIAMVFQNYALYPHMTVRENMAFPLKLKKYPKEEIRKRVDQAAEVLLHLLLGKLVAQYLVTERVNSVRVRNHAAANIGVHLIAPFRRFFYK